MGRHDPTEVYAARDEIDAAMVQTMLAEAGIEARIVGGQIMGAVGEVPAGLPSAPRIWVPDQDAESATSLIREMEQKRRETWLQNSQADGEESETPEASLGKQVATAAALGAFPDALTGNNADGSLTETGEVWECSGCQESVTVDFEICWNCQQPRDNTDVES